MKMIKDIKGKDIKVLIMAAAGAIDSTRLRKLTEISFHDKDVKINLFLPAKPGTQDYRINKRDYDTIKINSKVSYAEMIGKIKESVNPGTLEIEIKGTRKTSKDELIIRTERGKADILIKEIKDKVQVEDLTAGEVSNKKPMIVSVIESIATEEDLKKGIKSTLRAHTDTEIEVKRMYETKCGDNNAEIWLEEEQVQELARVGKVRVGWSVFNIKRNIRVDTCLTCLKLGHPTHKCRAQKQEIRCLNCNKSGHEVKNCKERPYCNECGRQGHRPTSTASPSFRRMTIHRR